MRKAQFRKSHDSVKVFLSESFTSAEPEQHFMQLGNMSHRRFLLFGMTEKEPISSFEVPKAGKALRAVVRELKSPSSSSDHKQIKAGPIKKLDLPRSLLPH